MIKPRDRFPQDVFVPFSGSDSNFGARESLQLHFILDYYETNGKGLKLLIKILAFELNQSPFF